MQPRSAIIRWDLSFSYGEFSLEANRKKFVGHRVLRPAFMALQAASYLRVKIASLLAPIQDTLRAPKTGYKRSSFEFDQASYATQDHGLEEVVDDRQIEIYSQVIKQEMYALKRAVNGVLQKYEDDVAQAVFNTGTFANAAAGAVEGGNACPWNGSAANVANATPLDTFDAACEIVARKCGSQPNSLIITDWGLKKLIRTAQITNLLKFSGFDDPKAFYRALPALAELLQIEEIIVAKGWKNTSDETAAGPAAPTLTRLWDPTMCMVCHISQEEDAEAAEPTIGRTFMWSAENGELPGAEGDSIGCIVEEYREEQRRGGTIRARNDRQIQVFHPEAGYLITDCTVLPS
jgi:hypothetical protein